jgi:hypothetical protein
MFKPNDIPSSSSSNYIEDAAKMNNVIDKLFDKIMESKQETTIREDTESSDDSCSGEH